MKARRSSSITCASGPFKNRLQVLCSVRCLIPSIPAQGTQATQIGTAFLGMVWQLPLQVCGLHHLCLFVCACVFVCLRELES